MLQKAAAVQIFLASGGTVWTRLRERSTGDVHDVPTGPLELVGAALPAQDVVAALEELARQGVVMPSLTVHPFDSTEYRVAWRL